MASWRKQDDCKVQAYLVQFILYNYFRRRTSTVEAKILKFKSCIRTFEPLFSGANSVKDYWVGDAATGSWEFRDSSKYTTDEFASDFMTMLDGRQGAGLTLLYSQKLN